jgi:hypothetical protein
MRNTVPGAAFVRSRRSLDQHAQVLIDLIGRDCGLADSVHTSQRAYELLATPQTALTLQRALADDADHVRTSTAALESFLTQLYRCDLIELSADS